MAVSVAQDLRRDRTLAASSVFSLGFHALILFLISGFFFHHPSLLPEPIEVTLLQTMESLPERGVPEAGSKTPATPGGKEIKAKAGRSEEPAKISRVKPEAEITGTGTEKVTPSWKEEERRRALEDERLKRLSSLKKDTGEERALFREERGVREGIPGEEAGIREGPLGRRLVLERVLPGYPEWARRKGIETEVVLKFWVSPDGKVKNVEIIRFSGIREFDELAENALYKWRFEPLHPQEPRVDEWGLLPMLWRLED